MCVWKGSTVADLSVSAGVMTGDKTMEIKTMMMMMMGSPSQYYIFLQVLGNYMTKFYTVRFRMDCTNKVSLSN